MSGLNALPQGFTKQWAEQKLAEFLKQTLSPQQIYQTFDPQYDVERGWYINIILNDNFYTDYFVFPDGRVTT